MCMLVRSQPKFSKKSVPFSRFISKSRDDLIVIDTVWDKKNRDFFVTFNRAYLHQFEVDLNNIKCKMIVR